MQARRRRGPRDERRSPLADRFPVFAARRPRARARAHGAARRERPGQDAACSKRSVGRAHTLVPRRQPTRCSSAPGPSRRSCAPRSSTGERRQLFEAEIRATGRNRILCNRQTGHARARPPRSAAGHGVLARRSRAREGRARRATRRTSTSSSAMLAARYDAARTRLRAGAEAAQRAAARRRARRRGARDARRVRRAARARRRPSSSRGRLQLVDRLVPVRQARLRRAGGRRPATSAATYEAEWADGPVDAADADEVEDACATPSPRAAGPRSIVASRSSARTATTGT